VAGGGGYLSGIFPPGTNLIYLSYIRLINLGTAGKIVGFKAFMSWVNNNQRIM